MFLAYKFTRGTFNLVSLTAKIILLGLEFTLSTPTAEKIQSFGHLSLNSTLQLINGISSDLPKLIKYFNDTAIIAFFRIPLNSFGAGRATIFLHNLALYLKDLK